MTRVLGRPSVAARALVGMLLVAGALGLSVAGPRGLTPDASAATPSLLGPAEVVLTDRVHLYFESPALADPNAVYFWDLDDDGSMETTTGGSPEVFIRPTSLGRQRVMVTARSAVASFTGEHVFSVLRPDLGTLTMSPANPAPGDPIKLRFRGNSDRSGDYLAYTWDVEGVKPKRTTTLLSRPLTARASTRTFDYNQATHLLDVKGTGLDVTTKPTISLRMPSGKDWLNETVTIKATAVTASGERHTLVKNVTLSKTASSFGTGEVDLDIVYNCNNLPSNLPAAPCIVAEHSQAKTGAATMFHDATPGIVYCTPVGVPATVANTTVKEAADLTYPSEPFFVGSTSSGRPDDPGADEGAPQPSRRGEACLKFSPQTVLWDFGDGDVVTPSGPGPVSHVFSSAGAHTVTVVTRIPFWKANKSGVLSEDVSWFKARRTFKVEVQGWRCLPVASSELRAVARPISGSSQSADGCFAVTRASDGTPIFTPEPGYQLGLYAAGAPGSQVVVGTSTWSAAMIHPAADQIVAPSGTLLASFPSPDGSAWRVIKTPVLQIPQPEKLPEYGGAWGARFPAFQFDDVETRPVLNGLPVSSAQLVAVRGYGLTAVLTTMMPSPMKGATPPTVVGPTGTAGRAVTELRDRVAAKAPPGVDFEIDVSGMKIGEVGITTGWVRHYTADNVWRASLLLDAGLGELDARYQPDPGGSQPATCEAFTGPSGLELGGDGSFHFAGAQFQTAAGQSVGVGPLGFTCLAFNAQSDPFIMSGRATGAISGVPIAFKACLAGGVLNAGDHPSQCAAHPTWVSPEDGLAWFRADGSITLADLITINGYLETRFGSNYKAILMGGSYHYIYESFWLDVDATLAVDGAVRLDNHQYQLFGTATGCIDVGPSFCGQATAGMSSKGFGACINKMGFVYRYAVADDPDYFVKSCDLVRDLSIPMRTAAERAAGAAFTVPKGTAEVSFVAQQDAGSPGFDMRAPDGRLFTDTGVSVKEPGYMVIHDEEDGQTGITITDPKPGTWRLVPHRDSSITKAESYLPHAGRMAGDVVRREGRTVLAFDGNLAKGDVVTFMESGANGMRILGRSKADDGSLTIPTAGSSGTRRVFALIERDGIPWKRVSIDSYQAPRVPNLAAPDGVTATLAGTSLRTTWDAVRGARGYRVSVKLGDGRTVVKEVETTSHTFLGVTRWAGGSVSVQALGSPGRDSALGRKALRPTTKIRLRV